MLRTAACLLVAIVALAAEGEPIPSAAAADAGSAPAPTASALAAPPAAAAYRLEPLPELPTPVTTAGDGPRPVASDPAPERRRGVRLIASGSVAAPGPADDDGDHGWALWQVVAAFLAGLGSGALLVRGGREARIRQGITAQVARLAGRVRVSGYTDERTLRRQRGGFTLIEVVIAFCILAVGVLALMDGVMSVRRATRSVEEDATAYQLLQALAERMQGASWYTLGQSPQPWSWHRIDRQAGEATTPLPAGTLGGAHSPPMTDGPLRVREANFTGADPADQDGDGRPDWSTTVVDGSETRGGVTYPRYLAIHHVGGDLWVWDPDPAKRVSSGAGRAIRTRYGLPDACIIRGNGLIAGAATGLPDLRVYLEYYNMVGSGGALFDHWDGAALAPGLASDRASWNANRTAFRLVVAGIARESPASFDSSGLNLLAMDDAIMVRAVVRWTGSAGVTITRELLFARRK